MSAVADEHLAEGAEVHGEEGVEGEEEYYEDGEEDLGEEGGELEGAETEAELAQLDEEQKHIHEQIGARQSAASTGASGVADSRAGSQQQAAVDENSIFIGQVDYEVQPEELEAHFKSCGPIERVTILCDKFTGMPKGYAYIEFVEAASVEKALKLHDSLLKGRQIKVSKKRQNVPSFQRGGRGFRGRGRGRFGYRPRGRGYRGGFRGYYRGYHPYY